MKQRRKVTKKENKKQFRKGINNVLSVNTPNTMMRGGVRL